MTTQTAEQINNTLPVMHSDKELIDMTGDLITALVHVQQGDDAIRALSKSFYNKLIEVCAPMTDSETVEEYLNKFEQSFRLKTYGWRTSKHDELAVHGRVAKDSKGNDYNVTDGCIESDGKAYKVTPRPMPGAYRSAKSTILKAVANGVFLTDEDGEPLSKGALTKAAGEANVKPFDDVLSTLMRTVNRLHKLKDEGYAVGDTEENVICDAVVQLRKLIEN